MNEQTMVMHFMKRYFTPQSFVNCAFYSALACLYPYLNNHLSELGLSWAYCAWINSIAALASMLGPLSLGPLAHKLSGYKQILVMCLMLASFSATALLFIPSVISSKHQPKMYLDCNDGVLRVEQCPNLKCHTFPKPKPAINFSSFELVTCSYFCENEKTSFNSSWYPVNVCFSNNNDPTNLCLDIPEKKIIPTDISLSQARNIQFDSRFDRWPVLDIDDSPMLSRLFDNQATCAYKPTPPLLMSQRIFSTIQCRPMVANCNIYCSVNLRHRTTGLSGSGQQLRPPLPCLIEQGNQRQTLLLYLLFRSLLDFTLLTAHTLIEAMRIANTNNHDAFYGGAERFWTLIFPFIVWPPITGAVCDYFVNVQAPVYAPPVVIFDGFLAIAMFLIIMLPLDSTQNKNKTLSSQKLTLQPTRFRYPRVHTNQYLLYRLTGLVLNVLMIGLLWGVTDSLIRPFYRRVLRSSNSLIGLATSLTFIVTGLFAYMAKSVVSGIGRMHLVLLSFVFYSLRTAGTSFLVADSDSKSWLVLPFEMMGSFCLPLAWIGITAYGQHLIKRAPNGLSYAMGTTIFQTYSPHVTMQYTLSLIHFGGGRALGAALASIWLTTWSDVYNNWLWLTDLDNTIIDNYALEAITNEETATRILFRFTALLSLVSGFIFFCLYHSCCFNWILPRHNKPNLQNVNGKSEKNAHNYLKLKSRSETEVYPLRNKDKTSSKQSGDAMTTRSMMTLREDSAQLESPVDDDYEAGFARRPSFAKHNKLEAKS